jgi:hypothetical protein
MTTSDLWTAVAAAVAITIIWWGTFIYLMLTV